jgi:hypothetical protein
LGVEADPALFQPEVEVERRPHSEDDCETSEDPAEAPSKAGYRERSASMAADQDHKIFPVVRLVQAKLLE